MPIWYTKGFPGHWPVGTSAIVSALSEASAKAALSREAKKLGLDLSPDDFTLTPFNDTEERAVILQDGDY